MGVLTRIGASLPGFSQVASGSPALPTTEQEAPSELEALSASPAEVKNFWTQISIDADRVDVIFKRIFDRLKKMRGWSARGLVNVDELEQAQEWWNLKKGILEYLLKYRFDYGVYLDEYFSDGSGI
jgi:hypothetical protein